MSYHFRLETVQKVRVNTRDERRRTLSEVLQTEEEISSEIEKTNIEIRKCLRDREAIADSGIIPIEKFLQIQRHESQLRDRLQRLKEKRTNIQNDVEIQRKSLQEADIAVKTLEKFDERQRRSYEENQLRRVA